MQTIDSYKINLYNKLFPFADISLTAKFKDIYNKMDSILETDFRSRFSQPEKKILIVQLNGCGDAIIFSGALRELRRNFPNYKITLVCLGFWQDIFKDCPYIDELIPCYAQDSTVPILLASSIEFCFRNLWNDYYDIAINSHWGQVGALSSFICWLSGAKQRIGYDLNIGQSYFSHSYLTGYFTEKDDYSPILTRTLINPPDIINEVDRRFWFIEQLNCKIQDRSLEIWLNDTNIINATRILNNVIGKKIIIGLGGSFQCKKYPVKKVFNVILYINKLNKGNNTFILVGGTSEQAEAEYLSKKLQQNNIPYILLINKNIKDIAAIIKLSNIYIGNDTNTVHIADAFNIPSIIYHCEAKDKENIEGKESLSSYLRFAPKKAIVLRPEHALDECQTTNVHGGCSRIDSQHCITQINEKEAIVAYIKLYKSNLI